MHEKSDKLSDKLTFVNDANVTIMFPNHLIESIINKQIEKVNNKLMDSIDEANDTLAELGKVEMIEKLDNVELIDTMARRIEKLEEFDIDYEVETKVQNELDYKDLVGPDEVHDIVTDKIDETDFVSEERFTDDIAELQKQLQSVERILGNEVIQLKNRSIFKRITKLIKKVFSYNFKNKVRFKLFSKK